MEIDNYSKKFTDQEIENRIKKYISDTESSIFWFNEILKVIEKMEGKKISKRFETELKKRFPKMNISLVYGPVFPSIIVWGNIIPYDERKTFYLKLHGENIFSQDVFKKENYFICYKARAAIDDYKSALNCVSNWNKKRNALIDELKALDSMLETYQVQYVFEN
jgi:hypothetical protein